MRDPEALENERNCKLMKSGRLEYGDAALAREAPASRNTIAANQVRLKPILDGLAALEAARKRAREELRLADREERRSIVEKDRIIDQQASVIAAQQVAIFGLERRIEAVEKRGVKPDKPSPALGRRRQRGRASAPQDRAASQAPQS